MVVAAALMWVGAGCRSTDGSQDVDAHPPATVVVTSGPETGDVFAHGTVHSAGDPVANAEVVIAVWPDVVDEEVGEEIDLHEVAVTTDAEGDWVVRLDPDTVPSRYFPADEDYLNFEVRVFAGDAMAVWNNTLHLVGEPPVWRTLGSRAGDSLMEIDMNLASEEITITDSQEEASTHPLPVM